MDFLTSLDNYNIFYEVAKCQNITKASENLFISQPAVSQSIKKLEENLGATLFVRSKKGMELTPIGQKIFEKIELALFNLAAAEQLVDEENGLLRGELVVGSGSNIAREVLCKPIADFAADFPLVNIKIVENVQTKMIEMLKSGKINFVLTQQNDDIDLPFLPVFDTQYCFVKAPKCNIPRFICTSEGSYTHLLLEKFFKDRNMSDVSVMEIAGYKTALELAILGAGTTLVPRYLVQELLNEKKLEEVFSDYPLPTIKFVVYHNPALSTPATKMFANYISSI